MSSILRLILDILVGAYAEIFSALLGLGGALALAKAPIESLGSRKAIFQILALDNILQEQTINEARVALVQEAQKLLERERKWNRLGAILLVFSFAVLSMHSIYSLKSEPDSHVAQPEHASK